MSIGIRSLLLALSLSAGLSAPAFATPFIDVTSFWAVAVGAWRRQRDPSPAGPIGDLRRNCQWF
jgi:hypothetical protein